MNQNVCVAPLPAAPVFEALGINKTVNQQHVLCDVSLALEAGEILGIYGKNASSKTTLIKALSGAITVDSGEYRINGLPVKITSPKQAIMLGIDALYDDSQCIGSLSISENLFLGKYSDIAGTSGFPGWYYNKKQIRQSAVALLEQYGIPIDVDQKVSTLSEAQKHILMVLRALVRASRILLIDDNISMLDEQEATKLLDMIRQIANQGVAVIYASQNPLHIQRIANHYMIISDGVLSEKKPIEAFRFPVRRESDFPKIHPATGDEIYGCVSLSYQQILHDISFTVKRGEVVGFLGTSNSGRTTLARIISGTLAPDGGTAFYEGNPISLTSPVAARKNGIIMISDGIKDHGLYLKMSVRDNIALSGYHKVCHSRIRFILSHKKLKSRTSHIADSLAIPSESLKKRAASLSIGQQRKVLFARSVFSGANLFVLDESTKGIDAAGRIQIYNIINELAREGKGIVFMTSDIHEALGICDRIFVLKNGRILCSCESQSSNAETLLRSVYAK